MLPLYEKYKASTGIHDIAGEIKAGMMYIALRKRQPLANPRALFWKIWTWQERNAPWILKVLPSITARTPFALEARRLVSHQYDGHAYVRQALDNGASCAVVDNPRYVFDSRCFLVPDVGKALMGLAACHRSQLKIPVIGISGSVGKSTTVKLAAAVLAQKHMVFFNLRNDALGLYISFLQMPANTEVAVLELATVFPGMLRDHCNRLRPSHGLLTHVGLAHQGTLGSIEGIQAAKWELYDFLIDNQGFTYLNVNHGWLASQTDRLHEAVTFGASEQAAVRGEIVSADPFLKLRLYSPEGSPPGAIEIQTSLAGAYNLDNILAAVAIGRSFGVPEADMIQTLQTTMPPSDRSRVISWGTNRVFIDSFHNNEAGLRSAMDSFLAFDHRPKMAVIGDIPDLGTGSRKGHRDLVEWILGCDLACVVFVGPRFYAVRRRGARFISSAGAYFRWLAKQDIQDTFIMVKGFTRLNLSRPFIRDHTE